MREEERERGIRDVKVVAAVERREGEGGREGGRERERGRKRCECCGSSWNKREVGCEDCGSS